MAVAAKATAMPQSLKTRSKMAKPLLHPPFGFEVVVTFVEITTGGGGAAPATAFPLG